MKATFYPLLILLALGVGSLQARPFYTTYVVPDGYRGPLILILDDENGVELPPPNEPWTISFGLDGKVIVKKDTYLPEHTSNRERTAENPGPRAQYANGESIPIEDRVSYDHVAFRSVYGVGPGVEEGETAQGAIYFFVGTLKEAKEFETSQKQK